MADALLDAILAAPEDDAPRLVWADREGGERGELVVIQCMLAKRGLGKDDRRRLMAREVELLRANGRRWGDIPHAASEIFSRGFVKRAAVALEVLARPAMVAEIFERAPMLSEVAMQGIEALANPYVRFSAEELWHPKRESIERAFAAFPPGRVRLLSVAPVVYVEPTGETVARPVGFATELAALIAEAPSLARLDGIELLNGLAGPEAFARLPRLERVRVYRGAIGPAEIARALPRLVELRFEDPVDDPMLAQLARVPVRFKRLGIAVLGPAGPGFEELVASPALADLESLELSGSRIDERVLSLLARSRLAEQLRELRLHVDVDLAASRVEAMFPAVESVRVSRTSQKRPA